MAVSRDGHGYWLVTRKGRVLAFGDAKYSGSAVGRRQDDTVAIAVPVMGAGYYTVASDGTVVPFGGAPAWGSAPNTPKSPVVAMATA
jgi:ribosomal protein L24E